MTKTRPSRSLTKSRPCLSQARPAAAPKPSASCSAFPSATGAVHHQAGRRGQAGDAPGVGDDGDPAVGGDAVGGRSLSLAVAGVADVNNPTLGIDGHAGQGARRGREGGRVGEDGGLALAVDAPEALPVGDE
jgi:hypothetical protein